VPDCLLSIYQFCPTKLLVSKWCRNAGISFSISAMCPGKSGAFPEAARKTPRVRWTYFSAASNSTLHVLRFFPTVFSRWQTLSCIGTRLRLQIRQAKSGMGYSIRAQGTRARSRILRLRLAVIKNRSARPRQTYREYPRSNRQQ
jgi:hypothetical protein